MTSASTGRRSRSRGPTWLGGGWASRLSTGLILTGWLSLTGPPDETPLLCPEVFSITGILSSTAALNRWSVSEEILEKTNKEVCVCRPHTHTPHVVVFLEQGVVLYRPLLELHVYAAAVDADDAPDAAGGGGEEEGWRKRGMERTRDGGLSTFTTHLSHTHTHSEEKQNPSYSTFWVMRVLSFMVAVSAKPLVAGDDMWDWRTVSKASRTSSSLT